MARASKVVPIISPQACFWGALLLLTVPLRWFLSWVLAAFCHECFHCLAVLLAGKRIFSIHIGTFGAEIRTEPLGPTLSMVCALTGPLGGLVLLIFARFIPRVALCALLQSTFNLLPVHPLDGSVALRGFLMLLVSEETAGKVCVWVEMLVVLLVVFICCAAACLWKLGIVPLLFAAAFLLLVKKRKIPCKYGLYRVQ